MTPGDIIQTPDRRYWRVLSTHRDEVRAKSVDTGTVRRLTRDGARLVEKHPGGPR